MKLRIVIFTAFAIAAGLLFSCGGSSSSVNSETKLISTTLSARQARAARALETSGCGTGFVACLTPNAVTGKTYYSGMIVGKTNGLSLGPMIGEVKNPSEATSFKESELLDIDLGKKLANTGKPTMGGPIPYPDDANAIVQNFHIYFGWFDVELTLASTDAGVPAELQTTHVIRLVMADIDGKEWKKGDLLYRLKADTDFKYCVSGSGCTSTTRPASPVTYDSVKSFSNTGQGNKTIPSFFVLPDANSKNVQVKKADLENKANKNIFTIDISMTNGVKFTTAPATWTTTDKLVSAFRVPAEPGKSDEGTAFTAKIEYSAN